MLPYCHRNQKLHANNLLANFKSSHLYHIFIKKEGPQWQQYSTTWPPWQEKNDLLLITNINTRTRQQYVINKKYEYKNQTDKPHKIMIPKRVPKTLFSTLSISFALLRCWSWKCLPQSSSIWSKTWQKQKQPTSISALLCVAKSSRLVVTEMRIILILGVYSVKHCVLYDVLNKELIPLCIW